MISKSFKIVAPYTFEIYMEDIVESNDEVVVKVDSTAICKADIRYYKGARTERVLGLKYPLALLHEATGRIVRDKSGVFSKNERVVLVPNITLDCDKCDDKICLRRDIGKNYCLTAKFASSNYDGFCKEFIKLPRENVVSIPDGLEDNIVVFTELISVAIAAIRRVDMIEEEYIAIWGDGILGYILCNILNHIYHKKVIMIGRHKEKLEQFDCEQYYLDTEDYYLNNVALGFECVGGQGMSAAINDALDKLGIGAKIVLTGVSEKDIPIQTRKILEKGMIITGSTRSCVEDFKEAIKLLNHIAFRQAIDKLIVKEIVIEDIKDIGQAFERQIATKELGKYILKMKF